VRDFKIYKVFMLLILSLILVSSVIAVCDEIVSDSVLNMSVSLNGSCTYTVQNITIDGDLTITGNGSVFNFTADVFNSVGGNTWTIDEVLIHPYGGSFNYITSGVGDYLNLIDIDRNDEFGGTGYLFQGTVNVSQLTVSQVEWLQGSSLVGNTTFYLNNEIDGQPGFNPVTKVGML